MVAKSQQERDAKAIAKREELDEKELRHRCRRGTRQRLEELMAWHGFTEQAEVIQLLIWNIHDLGPDGSAEALKIPRHEIEVSENVARRIYRLGKQDAAKLDQAEELTEPGSPETSP